MKKIKIAALCVVAVMLLLSTAACSLGGDKLDDAAAWDKAFEDTFAEMSKADGNVTIKAEIYSKVVSGDNVSTSAAKAITVYAEGKVKQGDTYYERVTTTEWGYTYTYWNVYEKNASGEYEKSSSSYGPDNSWSFGITSSTSGLEFSFFDFKNGKYVMNVDKMLEGLGSEYSVTFDKDKDKMEMSVVFKDKKIQSISAYVRQYLTGSESKISVKYQFGGAKVALPVVSDAK